MELFANAVIAKAAKKARLVEQWSSGRASVEQVNRLLLDQGIGAGFADFKHFAFANQRVVVRGHPNAAAGSQLLFVAHPTTDQ